MKTLLLIFKLFPLLLSAVKAVEEAVPLPGQGKKKLDLVLDVLKSAYDSFDSGIGCGVFDLRLNVSSIL